jgi:cell division protein FtsA
LILKGYDDYERNRKQFHQQFRAVEMPRELQKTPVAQQPEPEEPKSVPTEARRTELGINRFWSKFKDNLIDLFKEEEDQHL